MAKKELKYDLKIYIDEKRIKTKPFILNTLGNICKGFFGLAIDADQVPVKSGLRFQIEAYFIIFSDFFEQFTKI